MARILHWIAAGLIFGMVGVGLIMVHGSMTAGTKFGAYQLHKSVGILVFLLTLTRILSRVAGFGAPSSIGMSAREYRMSWVVQTLLYGLVLAMVASGWLMVSTAALRIPVSLPGGFSVPFLGASDPITEARAKLAHGVISKLLIVTTMLHIVGAARHYRLLRKHRKDQVLSSRSIE